MPPPPGLINISNVTYLSYYIKYAKQATKIVQWVKAFAKKPEFNPQDPRDGMREPAPSSLTSARVLRHKISPTEYYTAIATQHTQVKH